MGVNPPKTCYEETFIPCMCPGVRPVRLFPAPGAAGGVRFSGENDHFSRGILQDDSRKLLMIAYQDKFANALFSVFSFGTKYAQQLRFQYLSSLIYNSHIEMLQSEKFRFAGDRRYCTD